MADYDAQEPLAPSVQHPKGAQERVLGGPHHQFGTHFLCLALLLLLLRHHSQLSRMCNWCLEGAPRTAIWPALGQTLLLVEANEETEQETMTG